MTAPKLFTLMVTEAQLDVVQKALDLYVEIGRGKFVAILDHLPDRSDARGAEPLLRREVDTGRHLLEVAKMTLLPELNESVYFSIQAPQVPDEVRRAFDMFRDIRDQREGKEPHYDRTDPVMLSVRLLAVRGPCQHLLPDDEAAKCRHGLARGTSCPDCLCECPGCVRHEPRRGARGGVGGAIRDPAAENDCALNVPPAAPDTK